MKNQQESTTPPEFPRDQNLGAVSGVHPKLLVRKLAGTFVQGLTPDELYARYGACHDFVGQLEAYCQRKLEVDPSWAPNDLLQKVRVAVEARPDWDFTIGEVDWMMQLISVRMGWPTRTQF